MTFITCAFLYVKVNTFFIQVEGKKQKKKSRRKPIITLGEMVWEFLIIGDSKLLFSFGSGEMVLEITFGLTFWNENVFKHSHS